MSIDRFHCWDGKQDHHKSSFLERWLKAIISNRYLDLFLMVFLAMIYYLLLIESIYRQRELWH
jgi:hypothetical protein